MCFLSETYLSTWVKGSFVVVLAALAACGLPHRCPDGTEGTVCCGATALVGSNKCCSDDTQGASCCGGTVLASGNACCAGGTQQPSCLLSCPDGTTGSSCCGSKALASGNLCCSDASQGPTCCNPGPDCALPTTAHFGYFQLSCASSGTILCGGIWTSPATMAAGTWSATYTTGPYHIIPGQVTISLDGQVVGTSLATLPGGTVNPPVNLGLVSGGTHQITLQFASTNGSVAASWGGYLDLSVSN